MSSYLFERGIHSAIKANQAKQFAALAEREFAPHETTRSSSQYLLPKLYEPAFILKRQITYYAALEKTLHGSGQATVLDLGCGAGVWVAQQARNPLVDAYGITAKDYRLPSNRPPLVYKGRDVYGDHTFSSPDGRDLYFGLGVNSSVNIDDSHYLIGDIHKVLADIPTGTFDLVVSYQACRYLFDPLRVLKQLHRVLKPNGYAFLESFSPEIFTGEHKLSPEMVELVLKKLGLVVTYGKFQADGDRVRNGAAFKKTMPRLQLPFTYRSISENSLSRTQNLTYELV